MTYAGFYINLDHRADRRAEIEAELARHGIAERYRRFPAAHGNALNLANPHLKNGEMGCFTSHYQLLKQNLGSDKALHIIEDDIILSSATAPVIDGIIAQDLFAGCDIVYMDIFVPIQTAAYKAYKKFYDAAVTRDASGRISVNQFSVIDLQGLPFASTSSYLVRQNSIAKLHDLYAEEITHEPRQPNDLFIRRMSEVGKLKIGCVFPFVTSVRLDHILATDIDRDYHNMSALAAHLARYSFFVDTDLAICEDYLRRYLPLPAHPDRHSRILNHLLAFSQTDNYKSF